MTRDGVLINLIFYNQHMVVVALSSMVVMVACKKLNPHSES